MAKKIKLSAEIGLRIASLSSDLQNEYDELQDVFDNRSDTWRDSDIGMAADGWLESLEELIETLENFPEEPED